MDDEPLDFDDFGEEGADGIVIDEGRPLNLPVGLAKAAGGGPASSSPGAGPKPANSSAETIVSNHDSPGQPSSLLGGGPTPAVVPPHSAPNSPLYRKFSPADGRVVAEENVPEKISSLGGPPGLSGHLHPGLDRPLEVVEKAAWKGGGSPPDLVVAPGEAEDPALAEIERRDREQDEQDRRLKEESLAAQEMNPYGGVGAGAGADVEVLRDDEDLQPGVEQHAGGAGAPSSVMEDLHGRGTTPAAPKAPKPPKEKKKRDRADVEAGDRGPRKRDRNVEKKKKKRKKEDDRHEHDGFVVDERVDVDEEGPHASAGQRITERRDEEHSEENREGDHFRATEEDDFRSQTVARERFDATDGYWRLLLRDVVDDIVMIQHPHQYHVWWDEAPDRPKPSWSRDEAIYGAGAGPSAPSLYAAKGPPAPSMYAKGGEPPFYNLQHNKGAPGKDHYYYGGGGSGPRGKDGPREDHYTRMDGGGGHYIPAPPPMMVGPDHFHPGGAMWCG